ncbi:hypothetical protein DM02DRAFT_170749 [Periconia macrospinosa]|uniref:UBX domain-containing protein n=1 Tax=Periconia macrospinosa TaxID=97972 RepID=A0A2V1DAB7_9PLEO|nr:hypothetical protein DM02DRAFT_170749 [Periconia macrospinosa]
MSHVTVFNASAKSVRIPTTPTKYLTEVRDEACQKLGMSKDVYTLKYNNKPISLSQQVRLANLVQGARLELVQASRSPTVITVALQLPDQRLTKKLPNNVSLWELLRQFESEPGRNFNFTQRGVPEMNSNGKGAGRLNYEMPVITVLPDHKKYSTFVQLQKTLSQLGFDGGSALLKLSYENSGTPLEEAMTQITQYFKSSEPAASGAHARPPTQTTSIPDPDAAAEESTATVAGQTTRVDEPDPSPMEVDTDVDNKTSTQPASAPAASAPEHKDAAISSTISTSPPPPSSSTRNINVFAAPTSTTPQAARYAYNEADYIPTVEHAKSHQASLNSRTRNTRLLSDKELEDLASERTQKQAQAHEKGGKIRLRFPDGTLVESTISKGDSAKDVYDIAASVLDANLREQPFQLLRRDPTNPIRLATFAPDANALLFRDLNMWNSEMVTFRWDETASASARSAKSVLSSEWQQKAQVLKVEEPDVAPAEQQGAGAGAKGKVEGKRKVEMSNEEKENKLKNILTGGIFKKGGRK